MKSICQNAVHAMLLLALLVSSANAAGLSKRYIDTLDGTGIIVIATMRKDGTMSQSTPVWFTNTKDYSAVLIETDPDSWKAKRIRRGSPAYVWIGSPDGPAFIGKAEITHDPALQDLIIKDYPGRYMAAMFGFDRPSREKFDSGKSVAIKITPVRDFPDGFRCTPGKRAPKLEDSPPVTRN